jgi:hypothetical protein
MPDEAKKKPSDEIAALRAEVEALKAKVDPPKSTFVPMSDAEWRDQMHQLAEKRMSNATPPSVRQYFADGVTAADVADIKRTSHAPTGRPGMIPDSSQQVSNVRRGNVPGSGTGWAHEVKLSNPPGTGPGSPADRIADEFDRRDRAELVAREARFKATEKMAEQIETMRQQTEALAKLAEPKKE